MSVPIQKSYAYKIYSGVKSFWDVLVWDDGNWDGDTDRLVTVWRDDVLTDPTFRININGADGEIIVRLARKFDNFGEDNDVALGNIVKLYCYDTEAINGTLVYQGYIIGYTPTLNGEEEYVDVRVRGFGSTLSDRLLRDSDNNTTISYLSKDPSFILKDIIDKFVSNDQGRLGYSLATIDNTNAVVSYTFNTNTYREALDKVVELAPVGWYFSVYPDGMVYFKAKKNTVDHQFTLKKNVVMVKPERNIEDMVNSVYFVGGDTGSGENLFLRKDDTNSIDFYGLKIKKISDGRVTVAATATVMAERVIDERSIPLRKTQMRIVDSNGGSGTGYDIESIRVGDTCQVAEITTSQLTPNLWDVFIWDTDVWDNSSLADPRDIMQILSLSYTPDYIELEATTRLPEVAKRIEDINRNLESRAFTANPSSPTEV